MFKTLGTILKDNWEWRDKIAKLSMFEMKKKARGAALGWAWLLIKPGMYILCFWFALEIGLRVGNSSGGDGAPPYLLWLCAGLIPWFYMQEMLGTGCDALHRFPYLVNKIKFPISCISTLFSEATMITQIMLQLILFGVYLLYGIPVDKYLLQIPLLLLLMFLFWNTFSILFSQLTAFSKDLKNLVKALVTPFFWLSGILFNLDNISIGWIQTLMQYNPVSFFAVAFRDAYYDKTWFWEDPSLCFGFTVVFIVTFVMMLWVYKKLNEEVADVL